jgi:hypothetical protein
MKKKILNALTVCDVLPLVALPFVIVQVRVRGYESWEAIFLASGMVLLLVVLFLIG